MGKKFLCLGMMSGTSMDGVDIALLTTDGDDEITLHAAASYPYSPAEQAVLAAACPPPQADMSASGDMSVSADISVSTDAARRRAEELVTRRHIEAVKAFCTTHGRRAADIDLLGFHGQTIFHHPAQQRTKQIGDAAALAAATEIDVVADFRSADMQAGGQGAPLTPLFHAALARRDKLALPVAILNIGGVANVTYCGHDGTIMAFDTGPGNALLDDWVKRHTDNGFDVGGGLAAQGQVSEDALTDLLAHSYFKQKPPKSLDRNHFVGLLADMVDRPNSSARSLSARQSVETQQSSAARQSPPDWTPANGAATLTAFTARSIAAALQHFPQPPLRWIVCGGGRYNMTLLAALEAVLATYATSTASTASTAPAAPAPVCLADTLGWPGDMLEATAFAWLAVRSKQGLPLTLPETTGCARPTPGGKLYRH